MIKVVIDTNVFISALIGNGYCKFIVTKIFDDPTYHLCYSRETIAEIQKVIRYRHLTKKENFIEKAEKVVENILILGYEFFPTVSLSVLKDTSDNKFLELAIAANADYLVTGNHLDFSIDRYENVLIVSPKTFWLDITGNE